MAMKPLKKIDAKLQFLYKQNEFLNLKLRDCCVTLQLNRILTIHFDNTCISWYPLVPKLLKINASAFI